MDRRERCNKCLKPFSDRKSLNQHLGHAATCADFYETESTQRAAAQPKRVSAKDSLVPQDVPLVPAVAPEFDHERPDVGDVGGLSPAARRDVDWAPRPRPVPNQVVDTQPSAKRRRVTVEEVDEENEAPWVQEKYPRSVAAVFGRGVTAFEDMRSEQDSMGSGPHAPFQDAEEWGVVKWLMRRTNQVGADEFLKLDATRNRTQLTFKNKYAFFKKIDALPVGPKWTCDIVEVTGDRLGPNGKALTEELEIWRRDPVDCIADLIGNPAFSEIIAYEPVRIKRDGKRYYGEMCTADWWWTTQGRLPPGATIAPVILASDKTNLSVLRGDKAAWPVYLTIGNINKDVRRQPSSHASVLLGYVPVTKLGCFSDAARSEAQQRLFHRCMRVLLEPLVAAGTSGVMMTCADGQIRRVYPILAAYVADHPEQCLIACCLENRCPRCLVPRLKRGDETVYPLRKQDVTEALLARAAQGEDVPEMETQGVRPVLDPFWTGFPHADIFSSITPDILHQIHKGVIKDHLIVWLTKLVGKKELDDRFRAVSDTHGLRHFQNGISTISQWTGGEAKEIEKVLLSLLVGCVDPGVVRAARALLDFSYLAQYHVHTDTTLDAMDDALHRFHLEKDIFVELEIRAHFNIPKLHSLSHYVKAVRSLGTLDGLNTETSERLHIDYAKQAYRASSHREYITQMTLWLQRQEAIVRRDSYLVWVLGGSLGNDSGSEDEQALSDDEDEIDAYSTASNGAGDDASVPDSGAMPTRAIQDHVLRDLLNSNVRRAYQFPLAPTVQRVSLADLHKDYGAPDFLQDLRAFLAANVARPGSPNDFDRFNVFHSMTVLLPANMHISNSKRICKLRTIPSRPRIGQRKAQPKHFDCGLFLVDHEAYRLHGGVQGLCAGRVRVIFTLPAHLGSYPHPLFSDSLSDAEAKPEIVAEAASSACGDGSSAASTSVSDWSPWVAGSHVTAEEKKLCDEVVEKRDGLVTCSNIPGWLAAG
ncbi:hypothetical protein VTO73DRAFT_3609 [Trametes versicolor]